MRAKLWGLVCAALAGTAGSAACRAIDGLDDLSFDGGEDAGDDGGEDAGDDVTEDAGDAHDASTHTGDGGHVHQRFQDDDDAPPP